MTSNTAVISVRDLTVGFGDATVLDRASLDVFEGEILGFVGGSGAGKSVLMRAIIGLVPKRAGKIEVFGSDLATLNGRERRAILAHGDQRVAHAHENRVLLLPVLHFLLAFVQQRLRVVRLRRTIANRQREINSSLEGRVRPVK